MITLLALRHPTLECRMILLLDLCRFVPARFGDDIGTLWVWVPTINNSVISLSVASVYSDDSCYGFEIHA